jgi:hypothetical protein
MWGAPMAVNNENDQMMQRDRPPRKPSDITADRPAPSAADVRIDVRARRVWLWWALPALGVLALVGVEAWRWASSVTTDNDPSIVIIEHRGEDKFMEGIVYDKAALTVDDAQIVVIPDTATFERGVADGRVEVFMEKHAVKGTFPRPTSDEHIRDMRTCMGCVWRMEEGKLFLASYGEWSGMELEGDERLLFRFPDRLKIEARAGLSGATSVKGFDRFRQSPREPGVDGWQAIPTQPDPARTATRAKPSE